MFEREFYGREVMNVIACEGVERVERPETYKQWQVRCMRAGLQLLPVDQGLLKIFKDKVKAWYHKDFEIDQDSDWMLQGWKGRIVYASSCWVIGGNTSSMRRLHTASHTPEWNQLPRNRILGIPLYL
ncbi:hypothetical protein PS1_029669 [Malus domestica]